MDEVVVIRLSNTQSKNRKVLVVGLDGANIDLIKLWAREGKLPTFERLMREGSYGNLESVTPTITIPAWNCLSTGKNPAKLGCFSFVQKAYGSYEFRVYASLVKRERCVWDIMSDYGKQNFVFNAPNVLSAYKINGYMVAGCICTAEERLTYPRSLRAELYKQGYEKDISDFNTLMALNDTEHSKKHKEITEKQCKVLFQFLEKNWDFGFFVLTELDRVQHRFWDQKEILLSHYQNIDRNIGELVDRLERKKSEITLIFVSDHGFGKNRNLFLINEWLISKGFMEVRRTPALELLKTMLRILKKPQITKMLKPLTRIALLNQLYISLYFNTGRTPIIWDKTKAFSYGTWGTIYLNVSGREPQGMVNEEDYERLRTEIIEGLGELSVKAYRREELYQGEYLDLAPDIIVQTDDEVSSISARVGEQRVFKEEVGGAHDRLNGTFIAWGPTVKENNEINANLYDITPTILHIFGIPIPTDMDGCVLKEIFTDELAMQAIKYGGMEENKRVIKRLKELKKSRLL
ncbi:MAG: hypothetical protein EFT35_02780 [Methanophagales archaeon ANME-1-THS]|nr:MAG: hypothetical protein EFT35_02780 [Methanophagales archaeon ANME-1-THS]